MDVVAFSALGYIVTGLLLAMMLARKPHLPKKRRSYGQADSGATVVERGYAGSLHICRVLIGLYLGPL
jgi:hypothetical protein